MSSLGSPIRDSRSSNDAAASNALNKASASVGSGGKRGGGSRDGPRPRPMTREELVKMYNLSQGTAATLAHVTVGRCSSPQHRDGVDEGTGPVEAKGWAPPMGPKAPYLTPYRPAFNGEILVLENYGLGLEGAAKKPEFQPNNPSLSSPPLPLQCRVASARRKLHTVSGLGASEDELARSAGGHRPSRPVTAETAGSLAGELPQSARTGGSQFALAPRSAQSRFPRPRKDSQTAAAGGIGGGGGGELIPLGSPVLGTSPRPWIDFAHLMLTRDVHCAFVVERLAYMSQEFYEALRAAYYLKFPPPPGGGSVSNVNAHGAAALLTSSTSPIDMSIRPTLADESSQAGGPRDMTEADEDLRLLLQKKHSHAHNPSLSPSPRNHSSSNAPLTVHAAQLYSDSRNTTLPGDFEGSSRTITAMSDLMMAHHHSEAGGDDRASSVDTATQTLLAQFGHVSVGGVAGPNGNDPNGSDDSKAVGKKALQHELDSFRLRALGMGPAAAAPPAAVPTQANRRLSMLGGESVPAMKREIEMLEADIASRVRRQKIAREKAAKEEAAKRLQEEQRQQQLDATRTSLGQVVASKTRASRMKELMQKQQEARRLSAAAVTADVAAALSQMNQQQQQNHHQGAVDPLLGGDPALEELAVGVRDNLRFWQKNTFLLRQRVNTLSVKAKRTVFSTEADVLQLGQPQRPNSKALSPVPNTPPSMGGKRPMMMAATTAAGVADSTPPQGGGLFQPLLLGFDPCEICPAAQPLHRALSETLESLKVLVEETRVLSRRVNIMTTGTEKEKNALLKELGIPIPVRTPAAGRTVTPSKKGLANLNRDLGPKKKIFSKKKVEAPAPLNYQDIGVQCTLEAELTLYAFHRIDSLARKEISTRQLIRTMQVAMSNITQFWDDIEVDLSCYRCCTIPKEAMILSPCGTTCCRSCLTDDDDAAVNLHYLRDCDYPSHDGWISNAPVRRLVVAANTFREGKMESVIPEMTYAMGNLCTSISVDPSYVDLGRLVKGRDPQQVPDYSDELPPEMRLESSSMEKTLLDESSRATQPSKPLAAVVGDDDDDDFGNALELEDKALAIRRVDLGDLLLPGQPLPLDDEDALRIRNQIMQSVQVFLHR